MSRPPLVFALLTCGLLVGTGLRAPVGEGVESATQARVARDVAPDTVRASVAAGETLIHTLPRTTSGGRVSAYRMLRGPSLSGVAGRSLTWITQDVAPGTYDVRLRVLHTDAAPDTLVVRIEVRQ